MPKPSEPSVDFPLVWWRKKRKNELVPKEIDTLAIRRLAKTTSKPKLAAYLGISRTTLYAQLAGHLPYQQPLADKINAKLTALKGPAMLCQTISLGLIRRAAGRITVDSSRPGTDTKIKVISYPGNGRALTQRYDVATGEFLATRRVLREILDQAADLDHPDAGEALDYLIGKGLMTVPVSETILAEDTGFPYKRNLCLRIDLGKPGGDAEGEPAASEHWAPLMRSLSVHS